MIDMPLLIVKFPEEKWRKVNVSKFLSRFRNMNASKVVEVSDDEIDQVLDVLKRNKCTVEVVESKKDDFEISILKKVILRVEEIRLGSAEPEELEKVAMDTIVNFSLEKLSEEVSEILHDCIDFAKTPLLSDLKDIEERAEEVLRKKLDLNS